MKRKSRKKSFPQSVKKKIKLTHLPENEEHPSVFNLYTGLIVCIGIIIYWNSFQGTFLFDDNKQILENERIRTLSWPWPFIENVRRPVLYLSLALNYVWGGPHPFGYHFVNLLIHILAALLLFGIVRQTLSLTVAADDFKRDAASLAFAVAVLWLVHPLQTQSVTYIIQRAESLMGMFYLLTVYAAIRYFQSGFRTWIIIAGAACLFGGLTKEVIITAPLVIFLYDRAFISGSFIRALSKHKTLYAALSLTWVIMFYLFFTTNPEKTPTAGFDYKDVTPLQYALTQPAVVLHYLRLSFWPNPLILDYLWPPVKEGYGFLPGLFIILIMFFISIWYYGWSQRWKVLGFLGITFFLILSPSSSFIPLKDLAFEHRMYLPLACIMILVVLGIHRMLLKMISSPAERKKIAAATLAVIVGMFGFLTIQRNRDYSSEPGMWFDIVKKRPRNPRANLNHGVYLLEKGKLDEAKGFLEEAVRLNPLDHVVKAQALKDIGNYYNLRKDYHAAIPYYLQAIEILPDYTTAYISLGDVYFQTGQLEKAEGAYKNAIELAPRVAIVHNSLGAVYLRQNKIFQAVEQFEEALRLDKNYKNARHNLAVALSRIKNH